MKYFKIICLGLSMASLGVGISSCGNKAKTEAADQGPEYTSAYICPMHCKGSGSDAPGVCPACGMDYEANKNREAKHEHDGHDHGHDHEGHDHEGHSH